MTQKVDYNIKCREGVLYLNPFSSECIGDFMRWATDNEVTRYLMWNSYQTTEEAERFFENVVKNHCWFKAICLDNKVIGSISIDTGKGIHSHKGELGYVLARQYWGKGYATQAVRIALQTCFTDLGIERLEAYVDPINKGSQRILEKNGFYCEGLLRGYVNQKGNIRDRYIYSFLRFHKS